MSETEFDPEALMEAMAPLLRIEVQREYRPGIVQNLKVAAQMAALVEAVKLPDDAEPAPKFEP